MEVIMEIDRGRVGVGGRLGGGGGRNHVMCTIYTIDAEL